MLQQISKVHVLQQSSVKCVHYFWVYYSQWSNSAQWRIELFSNFGSILIDLKDKPRRKRFTLENFSTTQHQTSFFVVLARDSNFFLLFKVRILYCIKEKMKIASAFWVNNFVKWNINFTSKLPTFLAICGSNLPP